MLESWKVRPRKLGSWKVGMLESWNIGMLESWEVGKFESRDARKLESYVLKIGKLEISKVRSRKLESICRFSSCPRKSAFCRYLPVKIGKFRRMVGGVSIYIYTCIHKGVHVRMTIYEHMTLSILSSITQLRFCLAAQDSQIKLWDPRASEAITTIFCHKNTVTCVARSSCLHELPRDCEYQGW